VFEWPEGTVTAFRIARDGTLTRCADRPSHGSITAYASLDRGETRLLVANYGLDAPTRARDYGVAVFSVAADGSLGAVSALLSHAHFSRGPNAARQERAHPHAVLPSPDNRFLLVADLGIDRVLAYRFDAASGTVESEPAASLALAPGAGPRHLAFHPNGRWLFAINELDSTVAVIDFEGRSGGLQLLQRVSTLPLDFGGANDACAIALTPDGRFLYATNRGDDSVAMFTVDAKSGALVARGHVACGGRTPRCLTIDPKGHFALVANQNSDNVTVFRIDPVTGGLSAIAPSLAIGTPMSIVFHPN
jgi:6-phosphogluconolactonase